MRQATRYARRALWLCLFLAGQNPSAQAEGDDLIEGISGWADAVSGRSTAKWVGQRVAWPVPQARPISTGRIDSLLWPISVHTTRAPSPAELRLARAVLERAEHTFLLLAQTRLFEAHGDAGGGGTAQRDLYLVGDPTTQGFADADEVLSDLDAVHAFACLDARVPRRQLGACTAQALLEAELLELDPAESATLRTASAAYFAELAMGEACSLAEAPQPGLSFDLQGVLRTPEMSLGWLRALGAQRDQNRGVFLQNMWHFARQNTWEGDGLRGSPDLIEVIAKAFQLSNDRLEDSVGALSNTLALSVPRSWPKSAQGAVLWSKLPAHLPPSAPLQPLDASFRLVDLEAPRAGERLIIWARGELGVRWALSATRLRADGSVLSTANAAVRKNPDAELSLELDAETRFVLVSVTNVALGVPDPDLNDGRFERSVRLIIDRAR